MASAESMSEDPDINKLLVALRPVKQIYDTMHQAGGNTTVEKQKNGKLIIGADRNPMLSPSETELIREHVSRLRMNIFTGNF